MITLGDFSLWRKIFFIFFFYRTNSVVTTVLPLACFFWGGMGFSPPASVNTDYFGLYDVLQFDSGYRPICLSLIYKGKISYMLDAL